MDWSQWQTVAGSGQFPPNGWNKQPQQPGWSRPGQNQNNPNWPAINTNQGGQPRPGVHPDDWNSNMVPRPQQPPGMNSNNWPPHKPPPPPNGPPPDWEESGGRNPNQGNRRKNRRKNQMSEQDDQDGMLMPSPDPSMVPGLMNPPPTGPQWGTNVVGAVNTEESQEMSRNRQYGYAVMACAVVALAVLMVHCTFPL